LGGLATEVNSSNLILLQKQLHSLGVEILSVEPKKVFSNKSKKNKH